MLSGDQGSDQLDAGSGKDVCAPVNGKSKTKVSGCEKTAKIP
jgi:hypothetical protein